MDRSTTMRRAARRLGFGAAVVLLVALGAVAAWRWQGQQIDLVIVNQSGVQARLSWQSTLLAQPETITFDGCEGRSLMLRGGDTWRLEADNLDINSSFVDRPWLTTTIAFEIWLEPGGRSRIVGPYMIDAPVDAPYPSACVTVP